MHKSGALCSGYCQHEGLNLLCDLCLLSLEVCLCDSHYEQMPASILGNVTALPDPSEEFTSVL